MRKGSNRFHFPDALNKFNAYQSDDKDFQFLALYVFQTDYQPIQPNVQVQVCCYNDCLLLHGPLTNVSWYPKMHQKTWTKLVEQLKKFLSKEYFLFFTNSFNYRTYSESINISCLYFVQRKLSACNQPC